MLAALSAKAQIPVDRKHTETLLGPFPPEVRDSARISPDCRHIAHIEKTDAGETVVLDGRKRGAYGRVVAMDFSPDGSRLGHAARKGDQWYVVVGANEHGPFGRVGPPIFSPDGRRVAHVAMASGGKRTVVVDGKPGEPHDLISAGLIEFSPDGSHVAYGAVRDDRCYLVVDGERVRAIAEI